MYGVKKVLLCLHKLVWYDNLVGNLVDDQDPKFRFSKYNDNRVERALEKALQRFLT